MIEQFLRYFLPIFLVTYVLAAFFWRSYTVWKRTGIKPIVFKGSDDAHDFIGQISKPLFVLVGGVVLSYSFWPALYDYSVPIVWLDHSWLKWVAIALMLVSLVWTISAQAQMGESWRIGIDREHLTALVKAGPFRFCRNPIFLGMILTLLGLFLAIPNAVTLLTFGVTAVLIQVQVRLEEEFLRRTHGEDYVAYCRQVGRWF